MKLFGGNAQVFGLPRGRKVRKVPLPGAVQDAITAYMTVHPPLDVSLPSNVRGEKPTTASLLLTSRGKKALNRNYFNTFIWDPKNLAWVAATSGPSTAPARPQPTRNRRLGRSERYACHYYDI